MINIIIRSNFVYSYDDEIDTVTSYQKIHLEQLDKIEIGLLSKSYISS